MQRFYLAGLVLFAAALLMSGSALASGSEHAPGASGHVVLSPTELKWMAAPPVLPKGVQVAVLYGDPFAEGFAIIRVKIPAHTVFAPHWHPTAESFTVLKGTLFVGSGDKVDSSSATPATAGSFASLPALHHHYVYTEGKEAVIDLSFYGPFQIHYVNPADDPSNQR